jgi:hypothetical protein
LLALLIPAASALEAAAAKKKGEFASAEHILRWINGYRLKPEPAKLPSAVRAASALGIFATWIPPAFTSASWPVCCRSMRIGPKS